MKRWLTAAALFLLVPAVVSAQTMYVTDKLEVTLRAGKGTDFKILGFARSADKLEVLETDGGYARVRLPGGTEGWMLGRYLTAEVPKTLEATAAVEEIAKLTAVNSAAQAEIDALRQEMAGLEEQRARQDEKVKELAASLAVLKTECADYIKLRDEQSRLRQEAQTRQAVIDRLSQENDELKQKTQLMWFVFGSGAVLSGFIIGMWLQGLRNRRKRSRITF